MGGGRFSWQWPLPYHFRKSLSSSRRQTNEVALSQSLFEPLQSFEAFFVPSWRWRFLAETSFLRLPMKLYQKNNPTPKTPQKHDQCKQTNLYQKHLRILQRFLANASLQEYHIKSAKGRQVICVNKKNSWHEYDSYNARTSMTKCWDMVHKLKGKGGQETYLCLVNPMTQLLDQTISIIKSWNISLNLLSSSF